METIVRYVVRFKVEDGKWFGAEVFETIEEAEVYAKKVSASHDVKIIKRVSHCVAEFKSRGEKKPKSFGVYLTKGAPIIKADC